MSAEHVARTMRKLTDGGYADGDGAESLLRTIGPDRFVQEYVRTAAEFEETCKPGRQPPSKEEGHVINLAWRHHWEMSCKFIARGLAWKAKAVQYKRDAAAAEYDATVHAEAFESSRREVKLLRATISDQELRNDNLVGALLDMANAYDADVCAQRPRNERHSPVHRVGLDGTYLT